MNLGARSVQNTCGTDNSFAIAALRRRAECNYTAPARRRASLAWALPRLVHFVHQLHRAPRASLVRPLLDRAADRRVRQPDARGRRRLAGARARTYHARAGSGVA